MGLIYIFIVNIIKKEHGTDFKTLGNTVIKKRKFYGLQVILGNVAKTYIHPARGLEVIGPLQNFSLGHQKSFCSHIPATLQTESVFYGR